MRRIRLAEPAWRQIGELLAMTEQTFGLLAVDRYRRLLETAFRDLADQPDRPASRAVPGVEGLRLYHIKHSRGRVFGEPVRRPRHLVLFTYDDDILTVQQVLHGAMDLPARLTDETP